MSTFIRTLFALCLLMGLHSVSQAAYRQSPGTVQFSSGPYVFATFGGGDVYFGVTPAVAGCEYGFWITPSDPGFKQTYAMILLLQASGKPFAVSGYDDQKWTGTADPRTCKLHGIWPVYS